MTVLVLVDHYLPGYKAGGPVRSVVNLVERLGREFDFSIITSDRDLGDTRPYPGIKRGQWDPVGPARVLYLAPAEKRLLWLCHLLRTVPHDVLYLNSLFSRITIKVLLLRRSGLIPLKPLVLAPRGELSPGALGLKHQKKVLYLETAGFLGLCQGVLWQATSTQEAQHIWWALRKYCHSVSPLVHVAPNLPPKLQNPWNNNPLPKRPGAARVVFLSRIARKKNLDFALRLFFSIAGQVEFDIYGPIEDREYWRECEHLMCSVPPNIRVQYRGVVAPEKVVETFAQYHAFLFPTRSENYGHVIREALSAGCLVITSDQTPWETLSRVQAGWSLPLDSPDAFRAALLEVVEMDDTTFQQRSQQARNHALDTLAEPEAVEANRQLLLRAFPC